MDKTKALEILVQGIKVATKRGAYELEEAKILAEAVEQFVTKKEEPIMTEPITATENNEEKSPITSTEK
jgi:hypothetical protein